MGCTKEGALKRTARLAGLSIEEYQRRLDAGLRRCTRCKTWKALADFGNEIALITIVVACIIILIWQEWRRRNKAKWKAMKKRRRRARYCKRKGKTP